MDHSASGKAFVLDEKPFEKEKPTEKISKAALKNYQKAIQLTLEKSAPCRQRRYGMKNYDMA